MSLMISQPSEPEDLAYAKPRTVRTDPWVCFPFEQVGFNRGVINRRRGLSHMKVCSTPGCRQYRAAELRWVSVRAHLITLPPGTLPDLRS